MASVSSLDQDMRNLRMSRYTPQAANEVRAWIEDTLGESIAAGDLLDALKDGVALCKLANLVLPAPGIKYKASGMPFIQMENISHFLRACEMPPLNLPAHDRFLTVDLFESKDPAQVLQCLGAFSRKAHAAAPTRVASTIGPAKKGGGMVSPTSTGNANGTASFRGNNNAYGGRPRSPNKPSAAMPSSTRAMSPALTGGSNGSQTSNSNTTKSPSAVSSWSSRQDETVTSPAWNIHQYGYMGGASQGNQGISFGARRQITSQPPAVPSLAEKERKRKEKAMEEERARHLAEEEDQRKRAEKIAEEDREREEEERKWEAETRRLREEERSRVEEQKRLWSEQERRWKVEEEARKKEAAEVQASLVPKKQPPQKPRIASGSVLRGQTLSQYQREQEAASSPADDDLTPEQRRVRELEKQLEEARERERVYQAEREERLRNGTDRSRPSTATTQPGTETPRPQSARESEASWTGTDEREYLRGQWQNSRNGTPAKAIATGSSAPQASQPPLETSSPMARAGGAESHQRRPLPSQPPDEVQQLRSSSRPLPQPQVPDEDEEEEADEPPGLPHRQHHGPTDRTEDQDEDRSAPPFPLRPQQPQPLQPSTSSSSLTRLNPESAPSSSPLGTTNRPHPSSDSKYEPYSPTSRTTQPSQSATGYRGATAPPTKPLHFGSREQPQLSPSQQLEPQPPTSSLSSSLKPKAGQSLLEREMERERARQREWEADQEKLPPVPSGGADANAAKNASQPGWDVNQYGFTGGDNLNRGSSSGSGVNMGGRRQILGPRAMK